MSDRVVFLYSCPLVLCTNTKSVFSHKEYLHSLWEVFNVLFISDAGTRLNKVFSHRQVISNQTCYILHQHHLFMKEVRNVCAGK